MYLTLCYIATASDHDALHPSQETILSGSSDGLIRLCTVMPNKLLGVFGSHDDFPVESMKVKETLAVCLSHQS